MNSNCYPLRPWLADLLRETRFVEFDANTIASFAETLIGRSESLEKAVRITDLLSEQVAVPLISSTSIFLRNCERLRKLP